MKKTVLLSLLGSSLLLAGGYKIPETSLNSMALSAAYVANAHGADASYYNPANMAFDSAHALEVDLSYISLSGIDFKGDVSGTDMDASSESEGFLVPSLHYVSPHVGNAAFGLSITVPGGLSKRWEVQPATTYAKEFTLQVVEINPTVAYKINDNLAVGGGLRVIHSSGIVKSQGTASRDMEGESWDFGYNFALSYKPTKALSLAATYRSNVDLTEVGSAKLYFPDNANYSSDRKVYDDDASVTVPLPGALNLALAYTYESGTTVEFVYERTFWSAYSELDFGYVSSIGALTQNFDDPIAKDWKDVNAFRLGVTQQYEKWTAMAAVAYDESPVPEKSLNFELPDSNAWLVSMGGRYQVDDSWNIGMSGLIDLKDSRSINGDENEVGINGEFSNAKAYLLTLGVEYTF
jgi:long-chain fatty acid transport protein